MAESSKTCSKCKEILPLSCFHRNKTKRLGRQSSCIICECVVSSNWTPKHVEKIRTRQRNRRHTIKRKVFSHYGDACACCGETESAFLSMDHINEDGARHRKEITGKKRGMTGSGCWIYPWIIKNNFPNTLQILCFNCNWAKSHGGCPHQNKSILFSNTFIVSTR